MISANLVHLSYNMWCDWPNPVYDSPLRRHCMPTPELRFDDALWHEILAAMAAAGMNMVVIDVGDGVAFRSHPEIAVTGAWTPAHLADELRRCRDLGLEPIPKLNFSTAHDHWLGDYGRMVSTPVYYTVCRDLIAETAELFAGPRLFHLGMDEEIALHQRNYQFACMRQGALWWHDLHVLLEAVTAAGARPWVWADKIWGCGVAEFTANMPRKVLQSNWYYGLDMAPEQPAQQTMVEAFLRLDEAGYDQVPTASNYGAAGPSGQFGALAAYCREHLAPERLLGFCQTPWQPTLPDYRAEHLGAIADVAAAT